MQYIFKRGKDKRAPLFFMLHASGGTERDLVPLVKKFNETAPILSVRGEGSDAGETCFFNRAEDGSVDREDFKEKTAQTAAFLRETIKKYEMNERHIIAVAHSTGATMALHLLLKYPSLLKGAILYHPLVYNLSREQVDLSEKYVFIGATKNDPFISVTETNTLYKYLHDAGANVEVHWENGLHYLTGEEFAASRMWFEKMEKDVFTR
ncbi:MAG TPA: dienelactone hydrolase family protein [Pseudogracilibacillus sp.]|nr:dienelactone hydrolase family protein [Pseudogracilibacillus sp.]